MSTHICVQHLLVSCMWHLLCSFTFLSLISRGPDGGVCHWCLVASVIVTGVCVIVTFVWWCLCYCHCCLCHIVTVVCVIVTGISRSPWWCLCYCHCCLCYCHCCLVVSVLLCCLSYCHCCLYYCHWYLVVPMVVSVSFSSIRARPLFTNSTPMLTSPSGEVVSSSSTQAVGPDVLTIFAQMTFHCAQWVSLSNSSTDSGDQQDPSQPAGLGRASSPLGQTQMAFFRKLTSRGLRYIGWPGT